MGFFFVATTRQSEDCVLACLFRDTGLHEAGQTYRSILIRKATLVPSSTWCRPTTTPNREVSTQTACLGSRDGSSLQVLVDCPAA